jgi:hypothetical protein
MSIPPMSIPDWADTGFRLQIEVSEEHQRLIESVRLPHKQRFELYDRVSKAMLELLADVSPYDAASMLAGVMVTNLHRMPEEVARAFLRGMVAMMMDSLGYEPAARNTKLWMR